MDSLKHLLLLNISLIAVNLFITGGLWALTRSRLHLLAFSQWAIAAIVWFVQILTASRGNLAKVLGFASFVFFAHLSLAHLIASLSGFKLRNLHLSILMIAGTGISVTLNFFDVPPAVMAFPALLACGISTIEAGLRSLLGHWHQTTLAVRCFAVGVILFTLYNIGYVSTFIYPETIVQGYSIAIVFVFIISALAPAAVIETITKEKAAVEAEAKYKSTLIHSAKMTALGEMAGGVAHEINNPLAILMMSAEQIKEIARSENPTQTPNILRLAEQNIATVNRIKKIVVGLRNFSKDGSKEPLAPVKVQALLEDTLSFCLERFKSNGISLEIQIADPSLTFLGRFVDVSQVLLNLLNNAFDEVIKSENRWIKINALHNAGKVELRVTDSGPGVPMELRDKIFQPFFTTKELGKGTGMGLSISQGLIEALGGSLKLDLTTKDTCFVIRLPENVAKDLRTELKHAS